MSKGDRVALRGGNVTENSRPYEVYRREIPGESAASVVCASTVPRASIDLDPTICANADASFDGVEWLDGDLTDDVLTPTTFHLLTPCRARQFHFRRK